MSAKETVPLEWYNAIRKAQVEALMIAAELLHNEGEENYMSDEDKYDKMTSLVQVLSEALPRI